MSESGMSPNGPIDGSEALPASLERAREFIRQHRDRYTPEALAGSLRAAGYPEPLVEEAFREELAIAPPAPVATHDLRGRAASIVIVVFLAVWAGIAIPLLVVPAPTYYFRQAAAVILTVVLLVIGLLTLAVISESRRLRNGVEGAVAATLVVPFILLFIVAGICLYTETPWRAYP